MRTALICVSVVIITLLAFGVWLLWDEFHDKDSRGGMP